LQRLLIDECLSKVLVQVAADRDYSAEFVPHIGKAGMTDRDLTVVIEQGDYLFVTNNRLDFLALHGCMTVHNGLIVIIPNARRGEQVRLFGLALNRLSTLPDLANQVMEIDAGGEIALRPLATAEG
jgi:Domain of unknown function (DUF5615)